jgi:hypothetical protein
MSIYAIQQYHKELEKIIHYGGSKKETAIRNSFYNLLNEYARSKDLMLIPEISTKNKAGKVIRRTAPSKTASATIGAIGKAKMKVVVSILNTSQLGDQKFVT